MQRPTVASQLSTLDYPPDGAGLWAEIDSNERSGNVLIYPKTHLQLSSRGQEVNKLGPTYFQLMMQFFRCQLKMRTDADMR